MADTETPEPWAPEGASRIGAPPVNGEGGERGTSAYEGDGASDGRGPARGVEYHDGYDLGTHSGSATVTAAEAGDDGDD